jgi:hypothetical protein
MKKQIARLSKTEQQQVQDWYHRQKPQEFDNLMRRASTHSPNVIRLPPRLTATLKNLAKKEGEPDYQTMVTRWLRERAETEVRPAAKLSKKPRRKGVAKKHKKNKSVEMKH